MRTLRTVWSRANDLIDIVRDIVRRSPGTFVYLLVLAVTTAVVRSTSPSLSNELLRQVSTNLYEMGRSAGRVLLLSGFLLAGSSFVRVVLWFALVFAPLERAVGTWRWLMIVVAGHVGATLVTTVGIWADVRYHRGSTALTQAIDVGPSYALVAAAGFLVVGLAKRASRGVATGILVVYLVVPFVDGASFGDTGHAAAACIGAAMWLLVPAGATTAPLVSPLSWWSRRPEPVQLQPSTAP